MRVINLFKVSKEVGAFNCFDMTGYFCQFPSNTAAIVRETFREVTSVTTGRVDPRP